MSLPTARSDRSGARASNTRSGDDARSTAARPPALSLSVQVAVDDEDVPPRSTLRHWARAALQRDVRVTLRFVGAAEGRRLNREFRRRDYATNVLTFVYDDIPHDADHDAPLSGDIVICVPVVRREATAQRRALRAHYAHLVVHGMLHLQGYDHEADDEALVMEQHERDILARLRFPDPYAVA